jgi:hypothetical protein
MTTVVPALNKRDSRKNTLGKNSGVHLFWPQNEWQKFGKIENRASWGETKNITIKLAASCNQYEQQQDATNNAEF